MNDFKFFITMNAFLLKNKRKTLGIEWCLLCSRVFGLSPFLRMRSGQFVLFVFPFRRDCQNVEDNEYPIEGQVRSPAHVFKNTTAGTGNALPYVKKAHRYVNRECGKQREGNDQPHPAQAVKKKKDDDKKLNAGQQVNQVVCKSMREGLKVKLAAEFFNICQFTGSGVRV